MASDTREVVWESFRAAAGQITASESALAESLRAFTHSSSELPGVVGGLMQAVEELGLTNGIQESVAPAIASVTGSVPQQATGGSGISAGDVLGTVFKGAFGLVPLVQGIVGLFTGGGEEAPPPLVKYQLPAAVDVVQALWDGKAEEADYDQTGALRPLASPVVDGATGADNGSWARVERNDGREQSQQAVNVTVNAIDSRSFLDHSHEIAQAVREAMLNMNPINDVVSEL